MKNNKLIVYKESIFNKISRFFKKIFNIDRINEEQSISDNTTNTLQKSEFINNIAIKENEEDKRLKELQLKYENGEIDEDEILDEDMDKLIEMYKKETEKLNLDTKKRKNHISKMLNELKVSWLKVRNRKTF